MVDLKIKLPESFFEEEERYGYVTSCEMKQLWAVELDLLCEFDRVCKKLGIQYFLASGTLLGAIRDHRFIPWDDDIDVVMLREEYDKLLEKAPGEFSEPYFFQNAYTDVDYRRGISQLRNSSTTYVLTREIEKRLPFNQGVCIDIYVLDGLAPDSEIEAHFVEKQAIRKKIGDLAKKPGHDPAEVRELFREYEQISSRYRDAEYVDIVMFRRSTERYYKLRREWFLSSVAVEFEGYSFMAPVGYKGYLAAYYGEDFMTPKNVPAEHGGVIVDLDRPYTEVMPDLQKK